MKAWIQMVWVVLASVWWHSFFAHASHTQCPRTAPEKSGSVNPSGQNGLQAGEHMTKRTVDTNKLRCSSFCHTESKLGGLKEFGLVKHESVELKFIQGLEKVQAGALPKNVSKSVDSSMPKLQESCMFVWHNCL